MRLNTEKKHQIIIICNDASEAQENQLKKKKLLESVCL